MNNSPKVSIIMPVYNAEKYIAEAIDSILNQTFKDFELLVVNDASTDNTENIIKNYLARDNRIKLLQNIHEKGIAGGLNTALENSRGEYIARADGDDRIRPYRLEIQVDYLDKNQDIYLLGGGYAPFNENGHRMDVFHPTSSVEIAWKFLSNTYFCHPSVMFRKEIYYKIGGYRNVVAEDFSYFSEVVKIFKCANLKKILVDYRETPTNYSFSQAEKIQKSVRDKFEDNFKYYIGNTKNAEIFYEYQSKNILKLKDLWVIIKLNCIIIKKIRENYKISSFDKDVLKLQIKIFRDYLVKLFIL